MGLNNYIYYAASVDGINVYVKQPKHHLKVLEIYVRTTTILYYNNTVIQPVLKNENELFAYYAYTTTTVHVEVNNYEFTTIILLLLLPYHN